VTSRRGNESGIALLVVLLAITLLTIVVIEFTDAAQVETHQAFSARNALQATYLARSGVNVGEALVIYDAMLAKTGGVNRGDTLQDVWAGPYPPLPIGDGSAAIRVRDEARFLNLNDMFSGSNVQADRKGVFDRLFASLGIDRAVMVAIIDWMDEDGIPSVTPPGAEQAFYLSQPVPRRVRNGPLLTLRELLLVRGVTPAILARLEPFVTVLPPERFRVNINTAPAEVLRALSDDLRDDPGIVAHLIASRDTESFTSPSEALKNVTGLDKALGPSREFLDTASPYFRIESVAEIGDVRRGIVEVVRRNDTRITRVTWTPSTANLALTSQPPSDFLATLPALGGGS
jgi:general secretion pathway protein K